jgi:hypothetical protein
MHDAGGVGQLAYMCYQGTMILKQFVEKVKTIITDRISFTEKTTCRNMQEM